MTIVRTQNLLSPTAKKQAYCNKIEWKIRQRHKFFWMTLNFWSFEYLELWIVEVVDFIFHFAKIAPLRCSTCLSYNPYKLPSKNGLNLQYRLPCKSFAFIPFFSANKWERIIAFTLSSYSAKFPSWIAMMINGASAKVYPIFTTLWSYRLSKLVYATE